MSDTQFNKLAELVAYLHQLRHGEKAALPCPWTSAQDIKSLAPQTLEEAYELCDAVNSNDEDAIKSELSDLLYHLTFYASIIKDEDKGFSLDDLAQITLKKHEQRMPTDFTGMNAQDVNLYWDKQKKKKHHQAGLFAQLPKNLPSLIMAEKIQERAAIVGFDWDDIAPVIEKMEEEIAELKEAVASGDKANQAHELGDLALCLANLARHLNLDAEHCAHLANNRFMDRLNHMEASAKAQGKSLDDYSLDELEALWVKAKTSS